jgi:penicillin-binding protein 1C
MEDGESRLSCRQWMWVAGIGGCFVVFLVSLLWPLPGALSPDASVVSRLITDGEGRLLREMRHEGRGRPLRLSEVPPVAVEALLATEDRHFRRHPGVNPLALARAGWQAAASGSVVSGGSTITMQVARALRGSSSLPLLDKLLEMHLALRLELRYSKDDILELWLNRVFFGNHAHGIEAASRVYLGKGAVDLTLAEAAFLIGLPQSPSRYDPFRRPELARARYGRVLVAMERTGLVSPEERAALALLPLELVPPDRSFSAPHFTSWVDGLSGRSAGPIAEVRTTLDVRLQATVEGIVRGHLRGLRGQNVTNAAVLVLENRTGAVLAYVGSGNFWDDATGGQVDCVRMLRQPGSALKPFTYALALESGRYTPSTIVADIEMPVPEAGGAFSPQNYDRRHRGPVPLREALAGSYNVPAVRLAREFGPDAVLAAYRQAGLESLNQPADFYGVGITLGNGEVRLLDLARAYAGLARGGSLPPVRTIHWVRTAGGDTLRPHSEGVVPMGISPPTAYLIADMLSDAEARAPAFGRGGALELPFPTAVKTGTTKDYRDNWAVGFTPTHTVAVWTGNFDGKPMKWVSGVSGAAPIMKAVFLEIGPGGTFEKPDGIAEAVVCPASGGRPGAYCPVRRTERFAAGRVPSDTCAVHRLVRLDRETGLLADVSTPRSRVVEEVFAIHPPEYHGWMVGQGLPLPPDVSAAQLAERVTSSGEPQYSDALIVQYPESGMVFQIDPVLRRGYQRIRLRGAVAPTFFETRWWVNGEVLADDFTAASIPLTPGRHEIEIRGVATDGQRLRSRPVVIRVN